MGHALVQPNLAKETGGNLASALVDLNSILYTLQDTLSRLQTLNPDDTLTPIDLSKSPTNIAPLTIQTKTPYGPLRSVAISTAASGDTTLIPGVEGQKIRVFKLFLVANAANNITLKDGSAFNLTGVMNLTANGSVVLDHDGEPWFTSTTQTGFVLNLSAASQVSGAVYYTQG